MEGWAATTRLAVGVEHAWCVSVSGQVLDPTWLPGHGIAYVGLPVTAAYRAEVPFQTLLHHHEPGLALLRDGLPDRARVVVGDPVPADMARR